jgi:hypothetical protein
MFEATLAGCFAAFFMLDSVLAQLREPGLLQGLAG